MSRFSAIFADRAPVIYDVEGEAASYFDPAGSAGVSCTVQVERDEAMQTTDRSQGFESQTGRISVPVSTIPKVVKGGRFAVANELWTVETTPTVANGQNYCRVKRGDMDRIGMMRSKE